MSIDQDITNLPTPPSRNDSPSDFTEKADAFLGALPTFQSELNTYADEANALKTNVNTSESNAAESALDAQEAETAAENFADSAAGAANFVGAWDTLTGALTVPSSVSHVDAVWVLTQDVADVTAEEPGASNVWIEVTRALAKKPEITSPADGAQDTAPNLTIEGSGFSPVYSADQRDYRQVQIIESGGSFATPLIDEQISTDDYEFSGDPDSDYQARIRDKIVDSAFSAWSNVVTFNTANIFVEQPTISVSGSPDNITTSPTITTSAFNVVNGSDTHESTDWVVTETATNTVVFESLSDTSNLTSITLPSNTLDIDTEYEFKARHRAQTFGAGDFGSVTQTTANIFVEQPTITSPADNETDIGETPTITSSAFSVANGSDTHVASQWVITRVSDSVEVFDSGEDTSNLESIEVPAGVLDEGEVNYTVKVRHKGSTYGFSSYSPEITLTTSGSFEPRPGDPFAGGFLVGVIDTVAGTIDSQDDYQTGERYALVVAPKTLEGGQGSNPASGLTTGNLVWDAQGRSGESGCFTRWNGLEATNTIISKNDSNYQVFNFINECRTQYPAPAISGGSEWYLPALDELELIYRNLKSVTFDNSDFSTTNNFPGTQDSGFNPSSDPTGSAYTPTGEPFQTGVLDFQEGGAEALELSDGYWTSTDADETSQAWYNLFASQNFAGAQNGTGKTSQSFGVRPVRRVLL